MKNKYNINESVYNCKTKEVKTIKDFEFFESMVLYYFDGGGASPESKLLSPIFMEFMNVVNTSMEEKEKEIDNVLKNITNELNELA
jgi:hypothetical protein